MQMGAQLGKDLGRFQRSHPERRRPHQHVIASDVAGEGCKSPKGDFFTRAQELCRNYGTLLIVDEIQTGLGRTGKMFGFEHWNLEPDLIALAKSLSGGYVPCGAIAARRDVYQKTFSRMGRCVVHSTTFGRNNLAMACGLASLGKRSQRRLRSSARGAKPVLPSHADGEGPHARSHDIRSSRIAVQR